MVEEEEEDLNFKKRKRKERTLQSLRAVNIEHLGGATLISHELAKRSDQSVLTQAEEWHWENRFQLFADSPGNPERLATENK